jgi:hypothetical protein
VRLACARDQSSGAWRRSVGVVPVEDQAFGNGVLVDWWDSH